MTNHRTADSAGGRSMEHSPPTQVSIELKSQDAERLAGGLGLLRVGRSCFLFRGGNDFPVDSFADHQQSAASNPSGFGHDHREANIKSGTYRRLRFHVHRYVLAVNSHNGCAGAGAAPQGS